MIDQKVAQIIDFDFVRKERLYRSVAARVNHLIRSEYYRRPGPGCDCHWRKTATCELQRRFKLVSTPCVCGSSAWYRDCCGNLRCWKCRTVAPLVGGEKRVDP